MDSSFLAVLDAPTPEVLGCLGVTEADLGFTSLAGFFASGVLEDVLDKEGVSDPSGFGRREEEEGITWEESLDVLRLRGWGVVRPEG